MSKDTEKKPGTFMKKLRLYTAILLVIALIILYFMIKGKLAVAFVKAKYTLNIIFWVIVIILILMLIFKIKRFFKNRKAN